MEEADRFAPQPFERLHGHPCCPDCETSRNVGEAMEDNVAFFGNLLFG